MELTISMPQRTKHLFGWIGSIALLMIIPVKAVRWTAYSPTVATLIGIAPSILGPAGLLFLILSSSNPKLVRLTVTHATILAGTIAIAMEFVQLLPRPGMLASIHYTFDWLDVIGTLFSVSAGYVVARGLTHQKQ